MNKASSAWSEMRAMDELASAQSPIHSLHPLTKLFLTIAYIVITVSFDKYDLSGIMLMIIFPVLLYQIAGISVSTCFSKMKIVLPLVLAVGIINPFLDHTPMVRIGGVIVTGGVISMITLMLKGVFSLMASFLLMATTKVDSLCAALRRIHVPDLIVTLFLLTYRYIAVIIEQVSIMTDAYALRAPGQNGIHYKAWGSFLGQLLLRSMDRAGELYQSMQLRGFDGSFDYARTQKFQIRDLMILILGIALLIAARSFDLVSALGGLFV